MVAAIGTGDGSGSGRDFAAWLGLVPGQISTGDRTILGSLSKRGNRYLRGLFVQAAWVVLVKIGPLWLRQEWLPRTPKWQRASCSGGFRSHCPMRALPPLRARLFMQFRDTG